ncbi:hypothetical protein [Paracoccus mutanolyticus]|uniref:hypothetical protein n=1 Tax=Paracoccus mutanolyticus TaxID=1499308 RepID=UPI001674F514|nr:hypothetical protein [Paracoccus mutanolyticus]
MARLTSWLLVLLLSTAAIAQDIVLPAPSDETAADNGRTQAFLTAAAINLKRLAVALDPLIDAA